MDALFFHDGDPCPCCGEPIDLSKSSTIDAVKGLSKEMAKQIQKVKVDLMLLSVDAMAIAMGKAKEKAIEVLPIYISVYARYASLLDVVATEDLFGKMIDAELKQFAPNLPAYSVRRDKLMSALGIK